MKLRQNNNRAILLAFVASLIAAGCQQARPLPGIVQGASMAPNWLGEHQRVICRDCKYPIRFQLEASDVGTKTLVCPNCGYRDNSVSDAQAQPAQRVLIYSHEPFSRWDVVALKLPDSGLMGIKRVVGLPGERIEFRGGDLYVDGQMVSKPWSLQQEIRIPVYDSAHQPTLPSEHGRWVPAEADSLWRPTSEPLNGSMEGSWIFEASRETEVGELPRPLSAWDWLSYKHWRCCAHSGQRHDGYPLEDIDTFNPSLKRSLNPMADYCLEMVVRLSEAGAFGWRCSRGDLVIECRLDLESRRMTVRMLRNSSGSNEESEGNDAASIELPPELVRFGTRNVIEVSTIDNQLIIVVNNQLLIERRLPVIRDELTSDLLQVGSVRGRAELERVRIWRDLYYLPGPDKGVTEVPSDAFFLLGDNVPVSVDSRHWKTSTISRKNILGIVKPMTN